MMRHRYLAATLASSLLVLLAACGLDEGTALERGTLRVELGDMPFPFTMVSAAGLTVQSVSAHHVTPGGNEQWIAFGSGAGEYDLLELQNGVTAELVDEAIPTGTVDQIRLKVSEGFVELTDGRRFDLEVPSGSSSGLKVFPEPSVQIVGGLTTVVLLDVDVSRSFRAIPAAPQKVDEIRSFHFHPVLRVVNEMASGSISGHVYSTVGTPDSLADDLPLEDAVVRTYVGDDTVTAVTDTSGFYWLMGIDPGTWPVLATASGFEPDTLEVNVVAGTESAGRDFRLAPEAP
jgi:hypothetical protein